MKDLRIFLLITLLMTALLLCACNKTEELPPSEISTVFSIEEIELPDNFILSSTDITVSGGKVIVNGSSKLNPDAPWEDQKRLYVEIDSETCETTVNELGVIDPYGYNILSSAYSDSGEKYIVKAMKKDNYYEKMIIVKQSADGKELDSYDCAELFELDLSHFKNDMLSGTGGFYIRSVFEHNGYLYIISNTGAVRVDKDGTKSLVESRDEISTAALTDEGIILFFINSNTTPAYVNFDTGKLEEITMPSSNGRSMTPFPVKGYLFGASLSRNGIYGYKKNESGELEEVLLCDYNRSDISGNIFGAASVSPQEFYIIRYNSTDYLAHLYKLTMIKPEDIVEKTHLTVAVIGFIDEVSHNAITDFNLTNNKYHLDIKLYDYFDKTQDDIASMLEKDIISGNIPDIILAQTIALNTKDIENYAQKGLFCDLYSLMENAGWDKSQLLECVTGSFERKSKKTGKMELPYLPIKSYVNTLFGKASNFSGKLTLEEVLNRLDSLKDDQRLIDYTRLEFFIEHTLEEFIDYDTGETNFDTPLFRRYCEMFKRYLNQEFWRMDFDVTGDEAFRVGTSLLNSIGLTRYYYYIRSYIQSGADDIINVGYPDRDGSGIVLSPQQIFAISENCAHKDVAFEFLKFFATEKYFIGERYSSDDIPLITTELFEKYFDKLQRHVYIADSYSYGTTSIEPLDEEKAKERGFTYHFYADDEFIENYREMLLSARAEPPINDKIMDIIHEELRTYAERSDLSVDDVIKYITNRVSTYYNEQMK